MYVEVIWQILLTVCLNGDCATQDVQWFDTKESCYEWLVQYKQIPRDGEWDTIEWKCKPKGSEEV